MRNTINNLEEIRAQYVIHLRDYQVDFDVMHSLYNRLKFKLECFDQYQRTDVNSPQTLQTSSSLISSEKSSKAFAQKDVTLVNSQQNSAITNTTDLQETEIQNTQKQNGYMANHISENESEQNDDENKYSTVSAVNKEVSSQFTVNLTDIVWSVISKSFTKNNIFNKFTLSTGSVLCSAQYDQEGKHIAFSDGQYLFMTNSQTGSIERTFKIPQIADLNELYSRILRFSPDGNYIAISYCKSNIVIFSVKTGHTMATFSEHSLHVSSLAFFSDSTKLISGGHDGTMCVWDMNQWRILKKVTHTNLRQNGGKNAKNETSDNDEREKAIVSIAIGCNDSYIAIGFMKGEVGIYEPTMKQPMSTFVAHNNLILSISASKTEPLLLTASQDKTVKLWSLRGTAACLMTFSGHQDFVISTCFSKDDSLVLTGSKDETLRGWDRISGKCVFQIKAHDNTIFDVCHSPTMTEFISCSGDGRICAWEYKVPP